MLWQKALFIRKCLKMFLHFIFFDVFEFPNNKLNPVKCKNAKGLRVFNIAASTEAAHLQYENHSEIFICKNSSK